MGNAFRRFELLLAAKFNNGLPGPDDALAGTLLELEERFGAFHRRARQSRVNRVTKDRFTGTESVQIFVDVLPSSSGTASTRTGEMMTCHYNTNPAHYEPDLICRTEYRKRVKTEKHLI